jgi:glutathione S-transferase
LNYTASDLHVAIGGLLVSDHTPETQKFFLKLAAKRLLFANTHVLKKDQLFAVGPSFTIADAYLYIVLSWHRYVNVDLTPFPNVKAYFERIKSLPQVQAAHDRIATTPTSVL